jgi:hypothetical protein
MEEDTILKTSRSPRLALLALGSFDIILACHEPVEWRRGGDSNSRYRLRGTPVFETGALNRYATSPLKPIIL